MDEAWINWWFLNGGGIHRSRKDRDVEALAQWALHLPKAAWDEQQKTVDSLRLEITRLEESVRLAHAVRQGEEIAELRAQNRDLDGLCAALRVALNLALHTFRAELSKQQNTALARGELTCLLALGEEMKHVRMGQMPCDMETEHRERLRALGMSIFASKEGEHGR